MYTGPRMYTLTFSCLSCIFADFANASPDQTAIEGPALFAYRSVGSFQNSNNVEELLVRKIWTTPLLYFRKYYFSKCDMFLLDTNGVCVALSNWEKCRTLAVLAPVTVKNNPSLIILWMNDKCIQKEQFQKENCSTMFYTHLNTSSLKTFYILLSLCTFNDLAVSCTSNSPMLQFPCHCNPVQLTSPRFQQSDSSLTRDSR